MPRVYTHLEDLSKPIAWLWLVFTLPAWCFAADKLSISPNHPKQLSHSRLQFTVVLNRHDISDRVRWTSSNPAVAGINSRGEATLLSPGTTTISAQLGEGVQQASTVLTVTTAASPVFTAQPTDTNVSAMIDPGTGVRVQLRDNLGDPLPGESITITIGTNPPGTGMLSGSLRRVTDATGTATFPNLKIDWLGTGYTLVASANPSSGPVSGTSATFDELRVGDPCLGPAPPPSCPDADEDGLPDAWETAGGVDYNGDGLITDAQHDLLLPGADPNKPDVYVKYDWMDYGPMETGCNVDSDCSIMAGLSGFSCNGPALTAGFRATCAHSCNTDSDCTSGGLTHAQDRCVAQQCMHSHDPALLVPDGSGESAALDAVAAQFGRHGINLHIVRGQALPHSHVISLHRLNDPNIPANSISDSCEGGSLASGTAGAGKYAESFYDLKETSFDPRADIAYHYAIFGHYSACDTAEHCGLCSAASNPDGSAKSLNVPLLGQSGVAEFFGNDFIVSLANQINEIGNPPDRFNIGGTFMHELGHNLGLHHGGGFTADDTAEDRPDYKPNYLSVMNYAYQFFGIPMANACTLDSECPDGALCRGKSCARLDYSNQVLPTGTATPGLLNEHGALDETAGLGSGNSDMFFFTDAACNFQVAPTQGPVDWDGDGAAGDNPAATADLNPSGRLNIPCGSDTNELFRGHADWGPAATSKFTYKFRDTPFVEDGAPTVKSSTGSPARKTSPEVR
jgi:Bacterial Ig-like domain (group 2)